MLSVVKIIIFVFILVLYMLLFVLSLMVELFQCTFCGHTRATRQAFRRHLTLQHDADCRLEKGVSGKFADVIVVLFAKELASRVSVQRKGQRHVHRRAHEKAAMEPVVVPPWFLSSISARYSTPTAEASVAPIFVPADEACSSVTSEFDLGSGTNDSIDWECEELRHIVETDEIPPPDL